MLHCHSFSWWGDNDITLNFTWNSSHCIVYEIGQQLNMWLTHDEKPKIVDAQLTFIFRNGAVTVSLAVWPSNSAYKSIMLNSNQFTWQLHFIPTQKSITLCWYSLWGIVLSMSVAIDNCLDHYLNLLVAIQRDWATVLSHKPSRVILLDRLPTFSANWDFLVNQSVRLVYFCLCNNIHIWLLILPP